MEYFFPQLSCTRARQFYRINNGSDIIFKDFAVHTFSKFFIVIPSCPRFFSRPSEIVVNNGFIDLFFSPESFSSLVIITEQTIIHYVL